MKPIQIESAIPILPSRDVQASLAWYRRLGFEPVAAYGTEYGIIQRQGREIHFFHHTELDVKLNDHGCYIRLAGVDSLYEEWKRQGIERITELQDRAWGMREFAVVDPDGNLLRVGEIIPA